MAKDKDRKGEVPSGKGEPLNAAERVEREREK